MSGRINFTVAPNKVGWYGLLFGDGEGEVWIGAGYWDGQQWAKRMPHAYMRSTKAFATSEEAREWASAQPD